MSVSIILGFQFDFSSCNIWDGFYKSSHVIYMPAKVGIKSNRCAGECFHLYMVCSYLAAIVFDQTYVVSKDNAGC